MNIANESINSTFSSESTIDEQLAIDKSSETQVLSVQTADKIVIHIPLRSENYSIDSRSE